jgi:hypothetical protein
MPKTKSSRRDYQLTIAKPTHEPVLFLDLAKQMHVPMEEARGLLRALILMGHGMTELGHDEAGAVLTLARSAFKHLEAIDDTWYELLQAARNAARTPQ